MTKYMVYRDDIPCIFKKNVYSAFVGYNILNLSLKDRELILYLYILTDRFPRNSVKCWAKGIKYPSVTVN